jgi:hypothetical protein
MTIEPMPNALDLMFKVVSGGLIGDSGDDGKSGGKSDVSAMLEQVKGMIEAAVGEQPIWMANVSVSWAEGARRPSVDLAMIITDTKKLEGTRIDAFKRTASTAATPPVAAELNFVCESSKLRSQVGTYPTKK